MTSALIWEYHSILSLYLRLKILILDQFLYPRKIFFARGKSERSARQRLKIPVAIREIKKFDGQLQILGQIWTEFTLLPVTIFKNARVNHLSYLWQTTKSKSITGIENFNREKQTLYWITTEKGSSNLLQLWCSHTIAIVYWRKKLLRIKISLIFWLQLSFLSW